MLSFVGLRVVNERLKLGLQMQLKSLMEVVLRRALRITPGTAQNLEAGGVTGFGHTKRTGG